MEKFVRQGHENVKFFVGPEIEQTPAFNKKTLFVVGLQDTKQVEKLAREHKTPHIFLSANRSFDSVELKNGVYMVNDTLASDWEKQIHYLLDQGFMVSLDYPAHKHADVLKILNAGIWQSRNFVPVLSVAIPKVNTSSVNLTIKIDDVNFRATNPGVWCMNHHEITDSNRFTAWEEYGDDFVLTEDQIDTPAKSLVNTPDNVTKTLKVPVHADFKNPIDLSRLTALEQNALRDPDVLEGFNTVKNDTELGLDIEGKSKLKPDPDATQETNKNTTLPTTPELAAEAYAEGAKEDPLGKTAQKKTKVSKKAEA